LFDIISAICYNISTQINKNTKMSLKKYLLLMSATTLVAYVLVAAIIYNFDPLQSGLIIIVFFYASLMLALIGTFSVLGFLIRHLFDPRGVIFRQVITSFRQSIWLSALMVISILMYQRGVFSMITIVLLILALGILELYFITKNAKKNLV